MDESIYWVQSIEQEICFVLCALQRRKGIKPKNASDAFKRGGNWNNGTNAGAFTLNLNNSPGNSNTNIGFRCVRYFSKTGPSKIFTETSQSRKTTGLIPSSNGK